MSDHSKTNGTSRVNIIHAVQTPLGFFTLAILVAEVILGLLAGKAGDSDFTLLVVSMVGLMFLLVLIVAYIAYKNPDVLTKGGEKDSQRIAPVGSRGTEYDKFLAELIPDNIVNAIEHEARHHRSDHIRIACAHTVWSCRPDRAKPILEDAKRDLAEKVRDHAKALLGRFYYP